MEPIIRLFADYAQPEWLVDMVFLTSVLVGGVYLTLKVWEILAIRKHNKDKRQS